MDPISAMLMLSSALKGIRSCCEMLSEGKAEIQRIKKGVEDAKAIVKDVSGFFGWVKSLFLPEDNNQPKRYPMRYTTINPVIFSLDLVNPLLFLVPSVSLPCLFLFVKNLGIHSLVSAI